MSKRKHEKSVNKMIITERFLDKYKRGTKKKHVKRGTNNSQAGRREIGNELNYRQKAGLNS